MTPSTLFALVVAAEDAHGSGATCLLAAMCAELSERYQRPPSPFLPEEAAAARTAMVVARVDGEPVGCGALRRIDESTVEVKRMYVAREWRRRGVSRRVLTELERLAIGFGYQRIILETGSRQPEALALYERTGYRRTAAYGRYVADEEAHCFEKTLGEGKLSTSQVKNVT